MFSSQGEQERETRKSSCLLKMLLLFSLYLYSWITRGYFVGIEILYRELTLIYATPVQGRELQEVTWSHIVYH